MARMRVREDFRRDGLAANFLAGPRLLAQAARALPHAVLNVGYPSVCPAEERRCRRMIESIPAGDVEYAVVGHARPDQLKLLESVVSGHARASANVWIPVSDRFRASTLGGTAEELHARVGDAIRDWCARVRNPLDVALADCFVPAVGSRVSEWVDSFLEAGARRIILCDTMGHATPGQVRRRFEALRRHRGRLEFHPHDDAGWARENAIVAHAAGATHVGTAFFRGAERMTMLDPRELASHVEIDPDAAREFEHMYREQIGDPECAIREVFGPGVIVTGSQWRYRDRDPALEPRFGVTSDTYLASRILGRLVSPEDLATWKDVLLYDAGRRSLSAQELRERVA